MLLSAGVTVSVAGLTVKVWSTGAAAVYVRLPAWLASIVHSPAARIVIVSPWLPDEVQTEVVVEENTTGLPEAPPAALTVNGASP